MIALAVVGDDEIDLFQVNFFFQILDEIEAVRRPYGIDQDRLLLLDQIGILAGTVHDGIIVPVKALQLPVDVPHPAYVVFDVFSHARLLSLKTGFCPQTAFT